jgi:tripartite-type tricarboxylate transporter receptor subunit TctC
VIAGVVFVDVVPSRAQTPYFAGKSIEMIVPFAPGGGNDLDTRFFATFFEKHIPGNPRVTVRNMAGGGSILGANWFTENARKDGTHVLNTSGSTVIPFLLGAPQVRYEFSRWKLVKVNGVGGVVYVSPRTGVKTAADLKKPSQRLVYGGISAIGLDLSVLLLLELLEIDARVVMGFEGRGPARLAFERGETSIDYQTTPAYLTQVIPLVKEGKAVPLMSMGFVNERGALVRDPAAPDLPTPYEVFQQIYGRKPDGLLRWKAFYSSVAAGFAYQKVLWVPKEVPADVLQILRQAVESMKRDPEFRTQSKLVLEGYEVFTGDQMEQAVLRSMRLTLDVKKYITDLLTTKYNVRF